MFRELENRTIDADILVVDAAVSTLSYSTAHSARIPDPYIIFTETSLDEFDHREPDHRRRTDYDGLTLADISDWDIRNVFCDQPDFARISFRGSIDSKRQIDLLSPVLKVCFEHDLARILESCDHVYVFRTFSLAQILDYASYRRNCSTADNDDQLTAFKLMHIKAIAVRSAEEEAVTRLVVFKQIIRYFSYSSQCQVNVIRADSADRDRTLSDRRDRDLEKLSRFHISHVSKSEGPFLSRVFYYVLKL